jgi:hypothetical protein
MTLDSQSVKACCARVYASDAASYLLGENFHPGGNALTDELARTLDVAAGQIVVDIGSGPGTSAHRVAASTGCTVVGIDIAAGSSARTASKHVGIGRVRFVCGDAEALPVADASADGALSECSFCLFPDKRAAAREVARVLRRGARLALSDVTGDPARLPPALRNLDSHVACLAEALPLEVIAALLSDAGLTVERVHRRDDVVVPLLERIGAQLRLARLVGGTPLAGVTERAEEVLAAAWDAFRAGSIGYGVVVARREKLRAE